MSRPSAKRGVRPGHVTRKQQAKVLAQVKAQEIGENVADRIREATKQEVSKQLKPVTDTMTDLIERVLDLETHQKRTFADEGDSVGRHKGEETPEVSLDDQVAPEPSSKGGDAPDSGKTNHPFYGGLHA